MTPGETLPSPAGDDPTARELHAAYHRTGLWRLGWSYQRAIGAELIVRCLRRIALASRRREPGPSQPRLI